MAGTGPARVAIVSGSVGAGHDGVARELAHRLAEAGHEVDVLDLLDGLPWLTGVLLGSAYLLVLRRAPWAYEATCRLVERSRLVQRLADAVCCSGAAWLQVRVQDVDLVVATYPPAARVLGHLRLSGRLRAPAATYLTDPAPNFLWVHPAVDLHLAVGRATAEEAERRYGVPVVAGGPLVDRAFRRQDRTAARAHLRQVVGVPPEERVALVVLGSLGLGQVDAAVIALRAAALTPVVLCGRNDALRRRLSRRPGVVALGWRTDGPRLVAGADLVVHNAGGLSLTEAVVAGIPSLTFAPVAGHGRANARTLDDSGAVRWARTAQDLTRLARALAGTRVDPVPEEQEIAVGRLCALLAAARA
jgi:UDP-N-acetylglucosamine:LPS N-acetylglucosamine transferase